ncbi:NAD(P)/FAD-dependent oxidoreductase [Bacillus sp. FJAT-26390]|uniref:protoporphyrinogen/coproporphyrinogen oxidase n=1 Tax=Bacillus sp. FJAT-26390 TaxID=1743142 RepID=UPI000807EB8F|nr:FAD-dependent oxidoreductase [Bacillus sp. FJAT-26390]OBZ16517.1 hypothetical protein A7975_00900 [Bacillus sp. FJAT-26390]
MAFTVIGAGVTGLSFAKAFGNVPVLEAHSSLGGKALSYKVNTEAGIFGFDVGGHWFHHQHAPGALKLLDGLPLVKHNRSAYVYLEGRLYDFPFQQSYMANPDVDFVRRVDRELKTIQAEKISYTNYYEMLLHSYGRTLFDAFFRDYNIKMFGVEDLTSIDTGKFETVRNVRVSDNAAGYNSSFVYPKGDMGAQAIPMFLSKHANVSLNAHLQSINLRNKTMVVNNQKRPWDTIVSTIPLPTLIHMIEDAEPHYGRLADRLVSSKGLIVNLGVRQKPFHAGKSWVYVPEMKYHFYRMGFYSSVEPALAPQGYSSIYVECSPLYFEQRDDALKLLPIIIEELIEIGVIDDVNDVITLKPIYLEHNYCMPNQSLTATLHRYLESNHIYSIGRYGSWHWSSQHEDMQQAVDLAERLRSREAKATIDGACELTYNA